MRGCVSSSKPVTSPRQLAAAADDINITSCARSGAIPGGTPGATPGATPGSLPGASHIDVSGDTLTTRLPSLRPRTPVSADALTTTTSDAAKSGSGRRDTHTSPPTSPGRKGRFFVSPRAQTSATSPRDTGSASRDEQCLPSFPSEPSSPTAPRSALFHVDNEEANPSDTTTSPRLINRTRPPNPMRTTLDRAESSRRADSAAAAATSISTGAMTDAHPALSDRFAPVARSAMFTPVPPAFMQRESGHLNADDARLNQTDTSATTSTTTITTTTTTSKATTTPAWSPQPYSADAPTSVSPTRSHSFMSESPSLLKSQATLPRTRLETPSPDWKVPERQNARTGFEISFRGPEPRQSQPPLPSRDLYADTLRVLDAEDHLPDLLDAKDALDFVEAMTRAPSGLIRRYASVVVAWAMRYEDEIALAAIASMECRELDQALRRYWR